MIQDCVSERVGVDSSYYHIWVWAPSQSERSRCVSCVYMFACVAGAFWVRKVLNLTPHQSWELPRLNIVPTKSSSALDLFLSFSRSYSLT